MSEDGPRRLLAWQRGEGGFLGEPDPDDYPTSRAWRIAYDAWAKVHGPVVMAEYRRLLDGEGS